MNLRVFLVLLLSIVLSSEVHARLSYADQVGTGTRIGLPSVGALQAFELGQALDAGGRLYVRLDFAGAVLGTDLEVPNDVRLPFDEGGEYTGVVLDGGRVGDDFAIIQFDSLQLQIAATAPVQLFWNTDDNPMTFDEVVSTGALTITYGAYATATGAVNRTDPIATESVAYIEWVDGLEVALRETGLCYIDPVGDGTGFAPTAGGLNASTCTCGALDVTARSPGALPKGASIVYWLDGTAVRLGDLLSAQAALEITGPFDFVDGGAPGGGAFFSADDCNTFQVSVSAAGGDVARFPLDESELRGDALCLLADGETVIRPGAYEVTFVPDPAGPDVEFDRGNRELGTLCELFEPGIRATATPDPLVTSEAGATGELTFVLTAPPAASVSLSLSTDDATEALVDPSVVVFSPGTWDVARTVTVLGQDDAQGDGDQPFSVVTADLASADPLYDGLVVPDFAGTNRDDESPEVIIEAGAPPLVTSEFGDTATIEVSLASAPAAPVEVSATVDDGGEASLTPSALTFGPGDFATPQRFTVAGVDDEEIDGPQTFEIRFAVLSDDAAYASLEPPPLAGRNDDNEMQMLEPPPGVGECDGFGSSVDIAGPLITVGAPGVDTPECLARRAKGELPTSAGMVAVYRLEGGRPVLDAMLTVPQGFVADNFGGTMALNGNLLVVGAPGTPAPAKGAGPGEAKGGSLQALLFDRLGGQWNAKDPIAGNGAGGADDGFGASMAFDGQTLMIGAPNDSEGEVQGSGAAYRFAFESGGFVFRDKLKPALPRPGQQFGASVAVNDGAIAVGSPQGGVGGSTAGSASLFGLVGANLNPLGTVTGSGAGNGDGFGASMSVRGGLMAIGAPGNDAGGTDSGAVWQYAFSGTGFGELGMTMPDTPTPGAGFGSSVDVAGGNVAVGAPDGPGGGIAYLFSGLAQNLAFPAAAGQALNGDAVALDRERIVIGAPGTDNSTGAAMLISDPGRLFTDGFEN